MRRHRTQAIGLGVALVPEERRSQGLMLAQSVAFNINIASLQSLRVVDILPFLSSRKMRKQAGRLIKDLGVKTPSPSTRVSSLSGGNQQKALIARWLRPGTALDSRRTVSRRRYRRARRDPRHDSRTGAEWRRRHRHFVRCRGIGDPGRPGRGDPRGPCHRRTHRGRHKRGADHRNELPQESGLEERGRDDRDAGRGKRRTRNWFRPASTGGANFISRYGTIIGLLAMIVFFAINAPGTFLRERTFSTSSVKRR